MCPRIFLRGYPRKSILACPHVSANFFARVPAQIYFGLSTCQSMSLVCVRRKITTHAAQCSIEHNTKNIISIYFSCSRKIHHGKIPSHDFAGTRGGPWTNGYPWPLPTLLSHNTLQISSNQSGWIFMLRTDGDTDIFAEQSPSWHKITPLRSARFSTLREW